MIDEAARDELTRNMMALDAGLHRIADVFGEHVLLRDEDPIVFGAGHYVLYPVEGWTLRMAITEQYTGTDWSDDDRVPTSWRWEVEAHAAPGEPGYPWVILEAGEVASADHARLLAIAEGWATVIHALSEHEAALTSNVAEQPMTGPESPSRTFLT